MSGSSTSSVPRIQVFRPTMEEFKHFSKYIEQIESQGAHKAGLAKIIPPDGWNPRKKGYDDIRLVIPAPISQVVTGSQGLYQQINIQQKALTVKEFRKLAESNKFKTPPHFDYEDLERKYWKNITYNPPIYGADVSGSLYDDGIEEFNIQHLNTILDMVKKDYEIQIEGVNTAYLYFGMWKTTFAWHTEDMDLYSINYLHFGAPKSWYVIPPEHGRRLERLAAGFFYGSNQSCPAFLRHKMTIISPQILKKYSIPYSKITQEPGEFMITFPFGYHSGFNHGFNCAESTNFALPRWVEYGKRSNPCTCRNDCVKICMDMFVRKFQPEKYELWKAGKDLGCHPEDPSRHYVAPAPKKLELALSAQREERRKSKELQKIKRHPISKLDKIKKREICEIERDTDEETEYYDVNEVLSKSKSSKRPKKKEETSPEDSMITDDNESVDSKTEEPINLDFNITSDSAVKKEIKKEPEENCSFFGNGNDDLQKAETLSHISIKKVVLETKFEGDNPPELIPFWESPSKNYVKIKKEDENKNTHQGHMEILNEYPILREAINNGALSVVPISSNSPVISLWPKKFNSDSLEENILPDTITTIPLSLPISQTWRCEPVNDSLKIKLVQPKPTSTQNILKSPYETDHSQQPSPISSSKSSSSSNSSPNDCKNTTKSHHHDRRSSKRDSPNHSKNYKVKRADVSDESWASPVRHIWQHLPRNFQSEISYNEKLASIPSHCAICIIFTPMLNKSSFPPEPSEVPSYSQVKMPAFYYGNSLHSECVLDTNSLLRRDGTAPLLVCSICKTCVHATCYGISMLPMGPWTCTRCTKQAFNADCCLCVHRGGALKPTTDGRWAHVICAILIPEVFFESTEQKQPINLTQISKTRQRLKCKYCVKTSTPKRSKGICVQCLCGKCYLPFHVTCGYIAGVIFEANDWPEPIHTICTKHAAARRKPPKRELTSVSVGERVIAKHKNKRYYWANVTKKYIQEYYSILFEDNSHSTNTLPEDIIGQSLGHGTPPMNEKVQVKWTDEKVYNGIFKGSQSSELYVIEFDDGSVQHSERKQIYAADEELPKEILSKISHSSDGGSYSFLSEPEGKRIPVNSYKYNQDFDF